MKLLLDYNADENVIYDFGQKAREVPPVKGSTAIVKLIDKKYSKK